MAYIQAGTALINIECIVSITDNTINYAVVTSDGVSHTLTTAEGAKLVETVTDTYKVVTSLAGL